MTQTVTTYLVYLTISVLLTAWVARALHRNGRQFLLDIFANEELADSVNHLLVVGFYLINLGYVSLVLKLHNPVDSVQEGIEQLSAKLGGVLLVLGFMHFLNLLMFSRLRRRTLDERSLGTSSPSLAASCAGRS